MLYVIAYFTIAVFSCIIGLAKVNSKPDIDFKGLSDKYAARKNVLVLSCMWPIVPVLYVIVYSLVWLHDYFVDVFKRRARKKANIK